jgi:hypothetical protein
MAIPAKDLEALELKVRDLMGSGEWQRALEEIRAAAVLYGESRDGLVKRVAARAIEAGHVRPIVMQESAD